jgi:UDP:flavonoid glycosyltransferase YjiC (YdhE family)
VNMGLAAGVPMVVVPLFADQPYNARRVEEVGAGLALEPTDLSRLADAVRAVLADRSFRDSAGVIARETSRLPTVDSATEVLRRLAQAA